MNELLGDFILGEDGLGGDGGNAPINLAAFDSIAFTDVAAGWNLHAIASDNLNWSDEVVHSATGNYVQDTLTFNETLTTGLTLNIALEDELDFVDSAASVFIVSASDDIEWEDEALGVRVRPGIAPDTVTFTETLAAQLTVTKELFDPLELLDTVGRTVRRQLNVSDELIWSDSTQAQKVRAAFDTITFTDDATLFKVNVGRDVIDWGDFVVQTTVRNRSAADVFPLPDLYTANYTFRRNLSDTVTFTDAAVAKNSKPVNDTIAWTDSVVVNTSKPIYDTIVFTDTHAVTRSFTVQATDFVTWDDRDDTGVSLAIHRQMSDEILFTDEASGKRQKYVTLADDLYFVDEVFREMKAVVVDDFTTLTDTVTVNIRRNRIFDEVINFNDIVDVDVRRARGVADWWPLVDGVVLTIDPKDKNYKLPTGSVEGLGTSFVPGPADRPTLPDYLLPLTPYEDVFFTDVDPYLALFYAAGARAVRPINGQVPITIPPAVVLDSNGNPLPVAPIPQVPNGVIVVRNRVLIVGALSLIVLPPPELNDREAPESTTKLMRSMSGSVRTYNKTSLRRRIEWEFVVPKQKADEFRDFLDRENGNVLKITDWRGYVWKGFFINDDVTFTEFRRADPCGNWTRVRVEFSAVKIA